MFSRSWPSNDQAILLHVGLDFVETHQLPAVAKGMSGAGHLPGGLLSLLVGVPLALVPHFRSPNVLVGIFHISAFFLLVDVLRRRTSWRTTVIFAAIFWLSPWRLYHAGFLWEPSYLYLSVAGHLWLCDRLQQKKNPAWSLALGVLVILTMQIHASFVVLVVATVLMRAWRLIRIHYPAMLLGVCVGALTLIPAIIALVTGDSPRIAPQDGFPGRGFIVFFPLLKGISYWLRLPSLDAGSITKGLVFLKEEWIAGRPLGPHLAWSVRILQVLGYCSIGVCAYAVYQFIRQLSRGGLIAGIRDHWLFGYCFLMLVSTIVSAGLSPVTVQSWHVVLALPAACVSVAWGLAGLAKRHARLGLVIVCLMILLRIPLGIVIGTGHTRYRVRPVSETISPELDTPRLRGIIPGSMLQ